MLLAVVIPVYNEARLLRPCLDRLESTDPPAGCERLIVLVDDGSTDGSREQVDSYGSRPGYAVVLQPRNRGKGAAIRAGFEVARGRGADLALIHDADLEYDPRDHHAACAPIVNGDADVVIGNRFATGMTRGSGWFHRCVNRSLTIASNALTGLSIGDMECCTKVLSRPVLDRLRLKEDRFGLEPEIVARISRMRLETPAGPRRPRVVEVPVRYDGRTKSEGKKIGWSDGLSALRCIVKYGVFEG
ncbi:MAG: glycosyltransferase family 2 protein [Phycisphaerales bacterium]|nr:glycosyltransferase family 2 protein [Phycisphaerales bacterium]